jgi:hypothetical protein
MEKTMFNPKFSDTKIQKWGGIASFLMVFAIITSGLIYLSGNLRDTFGPFIYSLADLLYGPVWAVSFVTAVFALRERIGEAAPRRMNIALVASVAAACAFVAVASMRSANRHYHLTHPDLHLESSTTVLIVWATQVAGAIGAALHFHGWALILIGSAGWTSKRLPRTMSVLYLLTGAMSLLVLLLPQMEANALAFIVILSIWQGFLLIKDWSGNTQISEIKSIQPE